MEAGHDTIKPQPTLFGRRIVDIDHLFKQIKQEKHSGGLGCGFLEMDYVKEKLEGFHTTWTFRCRVCNKKSKIYSEDKEKRDVYMHVNDAAVHSIIATGGGYSQLKEFTAGMDMHCMSARTFMNHLKSVSKAIEDAALKAMLLAAKEEIAIAIEEGNVDSDGVPMCIVVADGAWCKRSYKTNYDSLSGVVSYILLLYI